MDRQHDAVAARHVAMHPLDHVGEDVGRRMLDRRGQIDHALSLGRRVPGLGHRIDDALGKFELGAREHFRRILEAKVGLRLLVRKALDHPRMRHGQLDDAVFVHSQHHVAHHWRGRVIEVDDHALGAAQRLEGARDQLAARLRQHLDRHTVGHQVLLDQHADEIELGLRCRWKSDLDLLEADAHEHLEHSQLARAVHRLDQRLVAVAQIDAAPQRRARQLRVGPAAIAQGNRCEGTVFGIRLLQHGDPR